MHLFRHFGTGILALALLAGSLPARAEVAAMARAGRPDDRAVLRGQIEAELAQRKARLAMIEAELQRQAKRYDEMAARKLELARIIAEKAEAAKEAAAEKAIKAQFAAAKAGPKPASKGAKDSKGKDAKAGDAKDAKAAGGGDAKGGKDAGAGAAAQGGNAGAAKPIDPMLTQNYLVLRLRDEDRQLRDRIGYLEGVLAKL